MLLWWKAVLLTALFLGVTLAVGFFGGLALALSGDLDDPDALAAQDTAVMPWVVAAGTLLGSIAMWAVAKRHVSRTSHRLRRTLLITLLFLAPAFLLVVGAALVNAFLLGFLPLRPDGYVVDAHRIAQLPFWMAFITWVVVPAVFEELAFRGVIQPGLTRAHGPVVGVAAGAVLFAVAHIEPYQVAAVFLPGVVFGYLRHISRSVYPAMVAHGFLNLLALFSTRMLIGNGASPPPDGGLPLLALLWGLGCVAIAVAMCRRLDRRLFPSPAPPPPDDDRPADPPLPANGGDEQPSRE